MTRRIRIVRESLSGRKVYEGTVEEIRSQWSNIPSVMALLDDDDITDFEIICRSLFIKVKMTEISD